MTKPKAKIQTKTRPISFTAKVVLFFRRLRSNLMRRFNSHKEEKKRNDKHRRTHLLLMFFCLYLLAKGEK
jgi:hypothetical protein